MDSEQLPRRFAATVYADVAGYSSHRRGRGRYPSQALRIFDAQILLSPPEEPKLDLRQPVQIGNVGQKETKRDLVAAPGVLARSFGCDGTLRSS